PPWPPWRPPPPSRCWPWPPWPWLWPPWLDWAGWSAWPLLPWLSPPPEAGAARASPCFLAGCSGAGAAGVAAGAADADSACAGASAFTVLRAAFLVARGLRTGLSALSPESGVLSDKCGFLARCERPPEGGQGVGRMVLREGCGGRTHAGSATKLAPCRAGDKMHGWERLGLEAGP